MQKERLQLIYRLLLLADVITLSLAFMVSYVVAPYVAYYLFGISLFDLEPLTKYLWLLVVIVPAWILILHINGRFLTLVSASSVRLLWSVVKTGAMATGLLALYLYATKNPLSRIFIISEAILSVLILFGEKLAMRRLLQILRRRSTGRQNVLILGTGDHACWAIETIREDPNSYLTGWGCLSASQDELEKTVAGVPVVGTLGDYRQIVWKNPVDEVLINPEITEALDIAEVIKYCDTIGVTVRIIPDFKIPEPQLWSRTRVEAFLGRPTITISAGPPRVGQLLIKRAVDVILSATLLVLLAPILAVIALAVRLGSPGPIFYRWRVVGRGIRPFTGYKFRTMVQNADELKESLSAFNEMSGPVFKIRNDPRITPLGRFLRKYSLDELPQLWSVFKGEMSLVGPRPPGPHEFERFELWHRRKLSVRPGITCLWQVSGRNRISNFDDWASLDLEYIDNWSLWLDLKILARTALAVARGTGV